MNIAWILSRKLVQYDILLGTIFTNIPYLYYYTIWLKIFFNNIFVFICELVYNIIIAGAVVVVIEW